MVEQFEALCAGRNERVNKSLQSPSDAESWSWQTVEDTAWLAASGATNPSLSVSVELEERVPQRVMID